MSGSAFPSVPHQLQRQLELDFATPEPSAPLAESTAPAPGSPKALSKRRILFVQMDWGMGAVALAKDLRAAGHEVIKVVQNSADYAFKIRGVRTVTYRRSLDQWEDWLRDYFHEEKIDTVFVYNPERCYNRVASRVAEEMNADVFVLELGLIRPLHITAYDAGQLSPAIVRQLWLDHLQNPLPRPLSNSPKSPAPIRSVSTRHHLWRMGIFAGAALLTRRLFPHYRDQRTFTARHHLVEGSRWLRRTFRANRTRREEQALVQSWAGTYFFVPLQVNWDCQIVRRSKFRNMEHFLEVVVNSFEHFAPAESRLVVKFHPQDRGGAHNDALITKLQNRLSFDRLTFIDAVPLDPVIENSLGVITVNSTVGLTALRHLKPVKALGEAIYDLPELTDQQTLDEFWNSPAAPEAERVHEFIDLLEATIQGRGSLDRKCYGGFGHSGVLWPRPFADALGLPHWRDSAESN